MKSKIFDEIKTPVQFICANEKVITLKLYYALSTLEDIIPNYRHLYLTQEETDVIELLSVEILKQYLLHLYSKHSKNYLHSNFLVKESDLILWYVEDYSKSTGYLIALSTKNCTVNIRANRVLMHIDIGITKEEFDAINVLCDIHPTLAYPIALEIAKQYQPTLEV